MPYIDPSVRPPYDVAIDEFFQLCDQDNWNSRLGALVIDIVATMRRSAVCLFQLHVEFLGVCMLSGFEMMKRHGGEAPPLEGVEPNISDAESSVIQTILTAILVHFPAHDPAVRPKHLSYIITELVNGAVARNWIGDAEPAQIIMGIAQHWVFYHSAPMLIEQRETFGDTRGFETTVGKAA